MDNDMIGVSFPIFAPNQVQICVIKTKQFYYLTEKTQTVVAD